MGSDKHAQLFLGLDISGYKDHVQFWILFASLMLFMCLYGLFQEMVIYDWFQRKLGVFTAALHFLGCIFCAAVLHILAAGSLKDGCMSLIGAPKAPLSSYFGLCILKVGLLNMSMGCDINFGNLCSQLDRRRHSSLLISACSTSTSRRRSC